MKIYTKTGDAGMTGLLGAGRVTKDDPRIEAYGTVDELNAMIGLARSNGMEPEMDGRLIQVQNDLFAVGAALADPNPEGRFRNAVTPDHVSRLEVWIDQIDSVLPSLSRFVLPAGTPAAARLHMARSIARRAERQVVRLARLDEQGVPTEVIMYLNRLSDFFFVMARQANVAAGVAETAWEGV